jgi:hypothetical protein
MQILNLAKMCSITQIHLFAISVINKGSTTQFLGSLYSIQTRAEMSELVYAFHVCTCGRPNVLVSKIAQ